MKSDLQNEDGIIDMDWGKMRSISVSKTLSQGYKDRFNKKKPSMNEFNPSNSDHDYYLCRRKTSEPLSNSCKLTE